MTPHRIEALVLKYYFNMRRNLDRVFDIVYWPTVSLFTWGFTTLYLEDVTQSSRFIAFFLSGLILWMLVQRDQQDFSTALMEDFWNQNIYNTFCSPLTTRDLFAATALYAVSRAVLTFAFLAVMASVFYAFNVVSLGAVLIAPMAAILTLFGCAIGAFVSGLIYRFGQRIQVFAWSTIILLQPFSAVFYPRETLPGLFHTISLAVPTSYVFEGMRASIEQGALPVAALQTATVLTLVYLAGGYAFFAVMIERARQHGHLAEQS